MPYRSRNDFDYKLAFHCGPVIAGIKPANLISLGKSEPSVLSAELTRVKKSFAGRSIYFHVLADEPQRISLLVYHRGLMEWQLSSPQVRRFLQSYGYSPTMSVAAMLRRLSQRMREDGDFPHEIGVFLGYPLDDVKAFIQRQGRDFQLCGYWKVYSNLSEATRLFVLYDQARSFFCARVMEGEEIHNIIYGGAVS